MPEQQDSDQLENGEPRDAGLPATVEPEAEARAAAGSDAEGGNDTDPGKGRGILPGLVPKLAIAVAIVAVLIASALWWQYRQFYVELAGDDAFLLENLESTRATQRGLEDEISALREEVAARDAVIAGLRSDLDALPAEIRAVGRRVEALQGGRIDARDTWLREQAEYYLMLANTELALGRRVRNAIAALELADDVLRDLGDPNLVDVRNAIAQELQALRAVPLPDLERYAADLGALAARAPALPMRAAAPQNFDAAGEPLEDVEPGLGRLWARTRGAVTSIVRVERADEPVGPILTEAERQVVRRQLALELQMARAAVLERREEALRASLVAADEILNRDFDRSAAEIIETRRLLAEVMRAELEPDLPDISDSLTLLRNAPGVD